MLRIRKKVAKSCVTVIIILFLSCCLSPLSALAATISELVPMGCTAGIQMSMNGILVVGISEIETENGPCSPAGYAGVLVGDIIIRLGNHDTKTAEEFMEALETLTGEDVSLTVRRGEKIIQFVIKPVMSQKGSYQLGLWLRDSVAGIGTITFYDPVSGLYGALGHSINDADTGILMPLGSGSIVSSKVVNVIKGICGKPGELGGSFDKNKVLGSILQNSGCGIFGIMDKESIIVEREPMQVAKEDEIELGAATILANINGSEVKEYSIEITRVYRNDVSGRCVMLKVTDPKLLEITGGIVKGMSGSPIIQNGKLIGAVTHVLVNDPDKGYGISIERMLDVAESNATAA